MFLRYNTLGSLIIHPNPTTINTNSTKECTRGKDLVHITASHNNYTSSNNNNNPRRQKQLKCTKNKETKSNLHNREKRLKLGWGGRGAGKRTRRGSSNNQQQQQQQQRNINKRRGGEYPT